MLMPQNLMLLLLWPLLIGAQLCAQESVARKWCDMTIESIRNDFARPPVHARNLHHISAAMHDAWALYEPLAVGFLVDGDYTWADQRAAQEEAISFAAYRLLQARFGNAPGASVLMPAYDALMDDLGYDKSYTGTVGNTPATWGNRIAASYLFYGFTDGSNEGNDFENTFYQPVNEPLVVALPGNPTLTNPARWQPLTLDFFIDQAGNIVPGATPAFLAAEWGLVKGFAIAEPDITIRERDGEFWPVVHDPGPPSELGTSTDAEYKRGFEHVSIWSSHLDPSDGVMIDISPNSIGNATLPTSPSEWESFYNVADGGDWGTGYAQNPVTGQPYPQQVVPRGDYARVLAEFWADGPDSELPPGHWFEILHSVNDALTDQELRIGGKGEPVDRLEWDIKSYFALGGCMHDAAIAAWSIKGYYDFPRPVSIIRWLAENGQCTDPLLPNYSDSGIDLEPGKIELITAASSAPGERHAHLAGNIDEIAVLAWRGPEFISDPATDTAGVGWILASDWMPYQRPTFVTPNFAGYVSGHSCFSRAAAVLLHNLTGSPYFPGGLGEFVLTANDYLVFEEGPSVDITLQWVSYYDASDQCSLSRIWGGIHPRVDDIPGREVGQIVGPAAWEKATSYWLEPDPCPQDFNDDGTVNGADLLIILSNWGFCPGCEADLNGDGTVNGLDLAILTSSWGDGCF
ncbi:MAG: hypothetical protein CMJ33_10760 [Phycisphaerae bacterium]|nr:hypothetical protein [Phycisphaerae bacterium]